MRQHAQINQDHSVGKQVQCEKVLEVEVSDARVDFTSVEEINDEVACVVKKNRLQHSTTEQLMCHLNFCLISVTITNLLYQQKTFKD